MEHRDLILVGICVIILVSAALFFNYNANITGFAAGQVSLTINAPAAAETQPTPTGTDVEVDFPTQDVTVTFDCVVVAGDTGVTESAASSKPAPPNFRSLGQFWEITTTADYTCAPPATTLITVCARGFDVHPGYKFFHHENVPPERWVDRTSFIDVDADIICAEVPYLSPFGVFASDAAAAADSTWSGGGGDGWDPRYASANTVYDAQRETETIVKEPEERPKVKILEKIKDVIEDFKGPAEEAEPEEELDVGLEPKPVIRAGKETAPMALLISMAFALIIIGLVIVFFKVEK